MGCTVSPTGYCAIYSGTLHLNGTTAQDDIAAFLALGRASRVLEHFNETCSTGLMVMTIGAVCIPGLLFARTPTRRILSVIGLGEIFRIYIQVPRRR